MQNNEKLQKKLFEEYGVALSVDDPALLIYQIHSGLTKDLLDAIYKVEQQKKDLDITNIKKILDTFTLVNGRVLTNSLTELKKESKSFDHHVSRIKDAERNIELTVSEIENTIKGAMYNSADYLKTIWEIMLIDLKNNIDIEGVREYRDTVQESKELLLDIKSRRTMDAIFYTSFGAVIFHLLINIFGVHIMLYDLVAAFITYLS